MAVDLNINPYYDDFDEFKDFHQLLFRPGFAVQARELTQLQSIISDQIKKFGTHIFQQGSVVIPGNSFADLYTPYIKLETAYNSQPVDGTQFVGKVVVGDTSDVRAIVRAYEPATSTEPLTLYLSYLSGGGTNGEFSTFQASEDLFIETDSTIRATVQATAPSGYGSTAFIKTGVFFVNGRFVTVKDSQVVISKYDSVPSCRVLLKITEEIVTSNEDDSLLDPASGSYNYAAPGADRLKVSLTLTTLPLATSLNDDYVEIMRFNAGVLEEHARYPKYSELEKSLARRTYDESGDYIVNGFKLAITEHLKTAYNDGYLTEENGGDRDKFVYKLQPGKAYVKGFEVEKIATTTLVVDKARTEPDHVKIKDQFIQPLYGQYIFVTNLVKLPNFRQREKVELWSASTGGAKIGEMNVYAIDLLEGDATGQNAVYKMYYHDVALTGSNKLSDVGRLVYGSGGSAKVLTRYNVINLAKDFYDAEDSPQDTITNTGSTRTAKVHRFVRTDSALFVFRHDSTKQIPIEGDFITGSGVNTPTATVKSTTSTVQQGSLPMLKVNVDSLKSIKNLASTYADLEYYSWTNVSVTTDGSGDGTVSISNATFVQPDTGIVVASGPSGIVSPSKISLLSPTILKITAGPASETVNVLVQVKKNSISPKSKVLTNLTLTGVTPANVISLTVSDVYEVTSIFDSNGNNVASNFSFDNGQRDFYYGVGRLNLIGALPTSNLTIQLKYFAHSGSGDFFSVDSYATLGAEYISKIPQYRSTNTAKIYNLREYLDFRPRVDDSTELFSSGGASLSDLPVVDTILSTPVQYYVPRIDVITMSKNGTISVLSGEPNVRPKKPLLPSDSIELYTSFVPAYTSLAKNVTSSLSSTTRYTMKDISELEKRISGIERLSILNSYENSLVRTEVVDPITGLNRFKSGYLVDSFTNPFSISDTTQGTAAASFNAQKFSSRREGFVGLSSVFTANGSSNYQNTNGQFTLPYTETAFISQNTSTKSNTLNPFSAISWEGVMKVGPAFDLSVQTVKPDSGDGGTTVVVPKPPVVVDDVVIKPPLVWPKEPEKPPYIEPEEPQVQVYPPVVTPPEKIVTITKSTSYVTEGSSVTFTINIQNGRFNPNTEAKVSSATYTWQISSATHPVGPSDFSDNLISGTLVVNSDNWTGTVTKTLVADGITEGTETFQFKVIDAWVNNDVLASTVVNITDSVPTTPATYNVSPSVNRVNEGDSLTWSITTENVSNGTTLYWTLSGSSSSSDVSTAYSGSVTITSNAGSVSTTITSDLTDEGEETLLFNLRTGSTAGPVVETVLVNINDTSRTPAPEPETVTVGILASNLGIEEQTLPDGSYNDTVIQVEVSKATVDAFEEVIAGKVIDATVDPQTWADAYAIALVATTEYGSTEWVRSVNNAVEYLTSLGVGAGNPKATWPGGEIYTILDNAYTTATSALGVPKRD